MTYLLQCLPRRADDFERPGRQRNQDPEAAYVRCLERICLNSPGGKHPRMEVYPEHASYVRLLRC